MRGEVIKAHFSEAQFHVIDTSIPFDAQHRLWRSLGFRYKVGPAVTAVNKYIIDELNRILTPTPNAQYPTPQILHPTPYTLTPPPSPLPPTSYTLTPKPYFTLIWIDKAVFITPKTTRLLRTMTDKLVHFTPDPAFTFHRSRHFYKSLPLYDYAVTSKSYELKQFREVLPGNRTILITQGYQSDFHKPIVAFKDKNEGVLFIGHFEQERAIVFEKLIDAGVKVAVAGINWEQFVKKNRGKSLFSYLGSGIFGEEYVKALSSYQFSWGAISKWIPELHTTRTFEIPACGSALITERNSETASFFNEDEAIFYTTIDEMIEKIRYYQNNPGQLELLTRKGLERVNNDGRDYGSIIREIIMKIGYE